MNGSSEQLQSSDGLIKKSLCVKMVLILLLPSQPEFVFEE